MEATYRRIKGVRAAAATALALAALVLAALTPSEPSAASSAPGSDPVAAASAGARVNIPGFKFQPRTLNVAKGTRVVFANSSRVPHTATRRGVFDTGRIRAGSSVAIRFRRKGSFAYFCKLHPEMRGKIVVG